MSTAMILTPVAILLLLLLSAFFSGSETAITAASRPRMHRLEQQGDEAAGIVNRLRENSERLIGTILLGNNLVNIAASALATRLLLELYGDAGVAYATLGMTLLVLLFAEVMPKSYAINNPDRLALIVAPGLRMLVTLTMPVTAGIQALARGSLALIGVRLTGTPVGSAEEELRGAIDLHEGPGPEIEDERRMLRSILDLDDVEVGEIVTHRSAMLTVDAGQPADTIIDEVLSGSFTRIPLWRDDPDNIVGVLHVRELLRALRGGAVEKIDVAALMAEPWFVPESTSLLDQLRAFRARREHFALVVDEYGVLMGVVTLEDILEEIVGDITDEHDVPVRGVRREADGSLIVDGTVTIRDLNREFEWSLPDEEAATVAGLVMHEARRIPEVGQTFVFHGIRFGILRRRKNRIVSLRLTPPGPAQPGNGSGEAPETGD